MLGAATGLGWANVSQLKGSISTIEGLAWLAAAVMVLLAAVMIALGKPTWWWIVAAAAAVWSQVVITTAWSDAKAGTAVNVTIILAAVLGFAALGPTSPRAEWQDKAETALQATPVGSQVLTEADHHGTAGGSLGVHPPLWRGWKATRLQLLRRRPRTDPWWP